MKKIIIFSILTAVLFAFSGCEEEFEPGQTNMMDMAGVWQVEHTYEGDGYGYTQIETYNTSDNSATEFWITDNGHFWWYKAKCPVNMETLTFEGTDLYSNYNDYEITVSIQNGKIIPNAAVTASGQSVDSIYFEIKYSDGGDDFHPVAGERYTGFTQDDL